MDTPIGKHNVIHKFWFQKATCGVRDVLARVEYIYQCFSYNPMSFGGGHIHNVRGTGLVF